jgi:PilZ domain
VNELFETLPLFEKGIDGIVAEALSMFMGDAAALDEQEKKLQSLRKKLHFTIVEPGAPIASTRNLSSGQQLWILGPKKTVLGLAMVTLVREFSFSVKLSSKNFEHMPLLESPLRMAFTRKADGIYGIEVPIVSVDRVENVVTCRHTLEFRRNQLRQDVRVETDFAVSIRCIATEAGDGKVQDPTAFMVKMIDLSGGGFSFITDRALAANDTVTVTAASPKLAIAGMQARIVGFTPIPGAGRTRYHAQFVNIDFETKENIIKYVFVRMREVNQR